MSKVKVKPSPTPPPADTPVLPVRVRVCVLPPAAGIPVEVRLVFAAAWRGNVLPQVQTVLTNDKGIAELQLPPTDEVVWLVKAPATLPPFFQVAIPGYGSFPVTIPSGVDTYTIGE